MYKISAVVSLLLVACGGWQFASAECPEPCPTFWTPWKDNCYRYFGEEVSWYDALNTCRLFSTDDNFRGFADLVSIHSLEEHEFVYHYWVSLREADSRALHPALWIGLSDEEVNGVHEWSDGSPVNFTYFNDDQNNNDAQWVYTMFDDPTSDAHGRWHDVSGYETQFMCKMPRPVD